MIAAVFGDVHGNLPAMYDLCQTWQDEHKEQLDLVLQTGDFSLWTSPDQMDKAAKKFYKQDQTELSAAPYLSSQKIAPITTWFIHGNHENFPLLAERQGLAVDPHGRITYLATGSVTEFCKGTEKLRVAALGGIEYRFGKFPIPSDKPVQKYLHPPSLQHLCEQKQNVDVLLLHDAPLNKGLRSRFPTGSKRITELIEILQPRFTFYGHYDDPPDPFYIGSTFCAPTNLASAKRIPNRDGAMGILRTDIWQFSYVEP
jgi:Icc-related predicted phosphoesterase